MANIVIPASLTEQVQQVKDMEISYRSLHPDVFLHDKQSDRTIKIPYSSITNKYKNFLWKVITEYDLTEKEQAFYAMKPKLLSMDLYDTPEFWNDLLILNYFVSVVDFKPKKLRCYDPLKFKKVLNEVMIIEEGTLF